MSASSSRLPARLGLVGGLVAAALAVVSVPAPPAHASAACIPHAQVPQIFPSRIGEAWATLSCTGSYNSIYYDIKLVNASGNVLAHSTGNWAGISETVAASGGCAGAIVHTFVWINVDGQVASSTSGSVGC
jgi:hypothetical protein